MIGDIVLSLAGRDKGKIFIITDSVDEQYVLVADGKHHKTASPKKKKLKHLEKIGACRLDDVPVTDKLLKKILSAESAYKVEE